MAMFGFIAVAVGAIRLAAAFSKQSLAAKIQSSIADLHAREERADPASVQKSG